MLSASTVTCPFDARVASNSRKFLSSARAALAGASVATTAASTTRRSRLMHAPTTTVSSARREARGGTLALRIAGDGGVDRGENVSDQEERPGHEHDVVAAAARDELLVCAHRIRDDAHRARCRRRDLVRVRAARLPRPGHDDLGCDRIENAQHLRPNLVAHDTEEHPDKPTYYKRSHLLHQDVDPRRVVGAIQYHVRRAPHYLEASRPAHAGEPRAHRRRRDRELRRELERAQRERRVVALVTADERDAETVDGTVSGAIHEGVLRAGREAVRRGRVGGGRVGDHGGAVVQRFGSDAEVAAENRKRAPERRRARRDHVGGLAARTGDDGDTGLHDTRLLARDRRDRVAEILLVIAADVGDHGDRRDDDVRRVEASAEADLEHLHLDALGGERDPREQRHHLERGEPACVVEVATQAPDAFDDLVLGDRHAVNGDALAKRDQVRRRIEADAPPRGAHDRVEHRRRRALAVRAADVQRRRRALRISEARRRRLDARELQIDAGARLAGVQPGEGAHVRVVAAHAPSWRRGAVRRRRRPTRSTPSLACAAGGAWPSTRGCASTSRARPVPRVSRRRSRRASVCLSSARSTTASSIPCLIKNSERWKSAGSCSFSVSAMTRGPAKPINARGSATLTSPSSATDAATPPVVGSVSTETYGRPAARNRPSAAVSFAICISE